jgi:uncharacterized protein (DUF1330 family)
MPAYLFLEIEWHDQNKAKEYRDKLGPTLDKYGARTLYAGPPQVMEGGWNPPRVVLIEFPTMDALRGWYASEEYAPLVQVRKQGSTTKMIAFDRVAP